MLLLHSPKALRYNGGDGTMTAGSRQKRPQRRAHPWPRSVRLAAGTRFLCRGPVVTGCTGDFPPSAKGTATTQLTLPARRRCDPKRAVTVGGRTLERCSQLRRQRRRSLRDTGRLEFMTFKTAALASI